MGGISPKPYDFVLGLHDGAARELLVADFVGDAGGGAEGDDGVDVRHALLDHRRRDHGEADAAAPGHAVVVVGDRVRVGPALRLALRGVFGEEHALGEGREGAGEEGLGLLVDLAVHSPVGALDNLHQVHGAFVLHLLRQHLAVEWHDPDGVWKEGSSGSEGVVMI